MLWGNNAEGFSQQFQVLCVPLHFKLEANYVGGSCGRMSIVETLSRNSSGKLAVR